MKTYSEIRNYIDQNSTAFQSCNHNMIISEKDTISNIFIDEKKLELTHQVQKDQQDIYIVVKKEKSCSLTVFENIRLDTAELAYYIVVEQGAGIDMYISLFKNNNIQCSISIYLLGDDAQANIKGLYAASENQKIVVDTYQYHKGINSKSELVIKGIVADSAKTSFKGLIVIDKGAKKVDASQQNHNITLSKDAKVVSVPSIEVLEHDVQCCHGSAIGKFAKEDIWYLQSKGLSLHKVYELLITSFYQDVLLQDQNVILESLCKKLTLTSKK